MNRVFAQDRHVGARAREVDGEARGDKMKRRVTQLRERQSHSAAQIAATDANLKELGYGG